MADRLLSSPPSPSRYDYVEVRDGVDESGQLVGKYCGKIAPSPVISSGNQLFIKFVSDYETHGAGFSIRYEIFKTGESCVRAVGFRVPRSCVCRGSPAIRQRRRRRRRRHCVASRFLSYSGAA